MKTQLTLALFLTVIILSTTAVAHPNGFSIDYVDYASDCPAGVTVAPTSSNISNSYLRINYNWYLYASATGNDYSNYKNSCEATIYVTVPAGWRFSVNEYFQNIANPVGNSLGYADIQGNGSAAVYVNWSLNDQNPVESDYNVISGIYYDQYNFYLEADNNNWTQCSTQNTTAVFKVKTEAVARTISSDPTSHTEVHVWMNQFHFDWMNDCPLAPTPDLPFRQNNRR